MVNFTSKSGGVWRGLQQPNTQEHGSLAKLGVCPKPQEHSVSPQDLTHELWTSELTSEGRPCPSSCPTLQLQPWHFNALSSRGWHLLGPGTLSQYLTDPLLTGFGPCTPHQPAHCSLDWCLSTHWGPKLLLAGVLLLLSWERVLGVEARAHTPIPAGDRPCKRLQAVSTPPSKYIVSIPLLEGLINRHGRDLICSSQQQGCRMSAHSDQNSYPRILGGYKPESSRIRHNGFS